MGLFSRRGRDEATATAAQTASPAANPAQPQLSADFQRALDEVRPLDMSVEFPDATEEQLARMENLWIEVVGKIGGGGTFEPQQIAAISTICDTLTEQNPTLAGFTSRLREIAQQEAQRQPHDPAWHWMATKL